MNIYRVGGWVRDKLLGIQAKDSDFVVVGATVEEFLAKFPEAQLIGKNFPVFLVKPGTIGSTDCLDLDWSGEYAFARTEKKVGPGHHGFQITADPSVTLTQDLERRDFTVNAMALPRLMSHTNIESRVIDPFDGLADLKAGILRHVSSAFGEDPLRVYRLARFAARYNWTIAPETYEIARSVPWDDILALSGERVWAETERALMSSDPWRFFEELAKMKVLGLWHRELMNLINVPAGPAEDHGEGDAFTHTMMVLREMVDYTHLYLEPAQDPRLRLALRFGALMHDVGKGVTPRLEWPSHNNHDENGVPEVEKFCDRLHVSNDLRAVAVMTCREHMRVHRFLEMRKGKMVDLVKAADKTYVKAEGLATISNCDSKGRIPGAPSPGSEALRIAATAARAEKGFPIPPSLKGENIGLHIRNQKGNAVHRILLERGLL